MIEFSHVTKRFKKLDAVRDVTFAIKDREIFGLLGPNGAGKTTLILTMATVCHRFVGCPLGRPHYGWLLLLHRVDDRVRHLTLNS